jgi:GNAT superfamily N-acetyltransferase
MTAALTIRPYQAADREGCLALFDENCPDYFAPNEREDYIRFLAEKTAHYLVCLLGDRLIGAFGVLPDEPQGLALRWILLSRRVQGQGLGRQIMARVIELVRAHGAESLYIGASHRSAPFFERFGARETARIAHGWGPEMHRVDMLLTPQPATAWQEK